jgi:hypothetical protein
VGPVPFVRDGDRQLVGDLMPEEHDLNAVDVAVGELSMRSCVWLVRVMVLPVLRPRLLLRRVWV